jgi:hypothetical protein
VHLRLQMPSNWLLRSRSTEICRQAVRSLSGNSTETNAISSLRPAIPLVFRITALGVTRLPVWQASLDHVCIWTTSRQIGQWFSWSMSDNRRPSHSSRIVSSCILQTVFGDCRVQIIPALSGTRSGTDISLAYLRSISLNHWQYVTCVGATLH